MTYVVLVTVLILFHYTYMGYQVGMARGKSGVKAPKMTGDETFERTLRVQLNTMEQLIVTLPALWMCAVYFNPLVAAILGFAFFVGRVIYGIAYIKDPSTRTLGMTIGFLANILLLVGAVVGVVL